MELGLLILQGKHSRVDSLINAQLRTSKTMGRCSGEGDLRTTIRDCTVTRNAGVIAPASLGPDWNVVDRPFVPPYTARDAAASI